MLRAMAVLHFSICSLKSCPAPAALAAGAGHYFSLTAYMGWSGGAMVLGNLPVPGRPTIWITVGQGPTALAVGAGGGCLDIFTLIYPFSPLSSSLLETARYRLEYCLKGPLNQKNPTNQPTYRIQPHLLRPLIIVRLKMTYLEIFQFNIVKYTTNHYVDCNAVSWFLICN